MVPTGADERGPAKSSGKDGPGDEHLEGHREDDAADPSSVANKSQAPHRSGDESLTNWHTLLSEDFPENLATEDRSSPQRSPRDTISQSLPSGSSSKSLASPKMQQPSEEDDMASCGPASGIDARQTLGPVGEPKCSTAVKRKLQRHACCTQCMRAVPNATCFQHTTTTSGPCKTGRGGGPAGSERRDKAQFV